MAMTLNSEDLAGIAGAVWDEVLTPGTHNVSKSAAKRLRTLRVSDSAAVDDAAPTTSSFITTLTGAYADFYKGQIITFSGTSALYGICRPILSYNESTKEVTLFEALPVAPENGDTFDILPNFTDESLPTLAEIEASTVLAKADALADVAAGVTAIDPPTIAGAVWNEPMSGHVEAGSAGEALQATAAAPSTPEEIAAAVLAAIVTGAVTVEDVLALLYGAQASGGSGGGAIAFAVTINVDGQPADGVEVWISTDLDGANVIAGTLTTDAFGAANFMLDAGTYQLWKQKAGVTFENPEEIVVS